MTVEQLTREVRWLKIYSAISTLIIVVAFVWIYRTLAVPHFAELSVERLNVVESDGRPALLLANSQRIPGPIFEGKELPKSLSAGRQNAAGLIFVDTKGNEVGGLLYGGVFRSDGTYTASSSLTLDQHNQDQVLGIQYDDNGRARTYGISVWDRPTKISLKEIVALANDRATMNARFEQLMKERGDVPTARRVFLGSQDRSASLRIGDTQGRDRIRIVVDANDSARIEFLDKEGNVTATLPQTESHR